MRQRIKSLPEKDNQSESPSAILVSASLQTDALDEIDNNLDELALLLSTLGIKDAGRVVQRRVAFTAKSLIGEGKVAEVKTLAIANGASVIAFENDLSPMQLRNLERMTGLKVYDRTGIIMQIFYEHAKTPQAKTLLEIARLKYLLPRLTGAWTHFHRQAGGQLNSKGMGETQIEVDRRRARARITKLERELVYIRQERQTQSKARRNELKVALVGYTNGGKTTLMNALTSAKLLAKDALFATLDASIRVLDGRSRPRILLSDTVGFIKNLPSPLLTSFKTTLDHVLDADLLLHVVDSSSANFREQISATEKVLAEIGAGHIPVMIVFNKIDLVPDRFYGRIIRQLYKDCVVVSAHNELDIQRLKDAVVKKVTRGMEQYPIRVAHRDAAMISAIYNHCVILAADYSDPVYVEFQVRCSEQVASKFNFADSTQEKISIVGCTTALSG